MPGAKMGGIMFLVRWKKRRAIRKVEGYFIEVVR